MKEVIQKSKFKKNILILLISQIIIKVFGLIYRLYLTNRSGFGDEGNAILNGSFQIYTLAFSIVSIGIPEAITKLVAERTSIGDNRGAYRIFKCSLFIFSIVGIIGSVLLIVFANNISNNYLHIYEAEISIIVLSPSIFIQSLIAVFKGYFNGREKLKYMGKAQSYEQLIKTIVSICLIEISIYYLKDENTEIMVACANLSTSIASFFELLSFIKAFLKDLPSIKSEIQSSRIVKVIRIVNIVKEIAKVSIPISATAMILSVSKNLDSRMIINGLSNLVGYEKAKIQYGILSGKVDGLINLPLSFNMAIITALLPSIASNKTNEKKRNERINEAFEIGMIITIPIIFVYIMYSKQIIKLLFPNALEGEILLKINSILILFITIEQITNTILHSIGKNYIPIIAIFFGVIIKFVFNKALIANTNWWGGAIGASISSIISHSIICIIVLCNMKVKIKLEKFIRPIISSIGLLVVSKTCYEILIDKMNKNLSFVLALLLAILVYFIIIIMLGKVSKYKKN